MTNQIEMFMGMMFATVNIDIAEQSENKDRFRASSKAEAEVSGLHRP